MCKYGLISIDGGNIQAEAKLYETEKGASTAMRGFVADYLRIATRGFTVSVADDGMTAHAVNGKRECEWRVIKFDEPETVPETVVADTAPVTRSAMRYSAEKSRLSARGRQYLIDRDANIKPADKLEAEREYLSRAAHYCGLVSEFRQCGIIQ